MRQAHEQAAPDPRAAGIVGDAAQPPVPAVALAKFLERFRQRFERFEMPHPEKLLPEGAERACDRAVVFGFAHESG